MSNTLSNENPKQPEAESGSCAPPCSALTEDQLEIAARKYCELAGVDPDKSVAHGADPDGNGVVPAVCLYSPQWQLVAREIAQHDAVRVCIAFAQNAKDHAS